MGIFYATREQVMRSLEILQSAYAGSLIDAKIDSSSRSIEGQLHRRFYPERRTILKDWPNPNPAYTWEVDLGDQTLISVTAVTSGGTDITSNVFLRRGDDLQEPPYSFLQVNLASASSFAASTTFQRSLSIAGLFGHNDTDVSLAGGLMNGAINASVSTIAIKPSSGILTPGVGSILLVGTERMIVADRRLVATGDTTGGGNSASQADRVIPCGGASNFATGEVILIDGERMLINDIVPGASLIVTRAFDGTVLAAHLTGATIYALRSFTVRRGALGSTAAVHSDLDSVYPHNFPGLINELCVAETVCALEQNAGAYARTVGTGSSARDAVGAGLEDVRARAYAAYGRKNRSAAI